MTEIPFMIQILPKRHEFDDFFGFFKIKGSLAVVDSALRRLNKVLLFFTKRELARYVLVTDIYVGLQKFCK